MIRVVLCVPGLQQQQPGKKTSWVAHSSPLYIILLRILLVMVMEMTNRIILVVMVFGFTFPVYGVSKGPNLLKNCPFGVPGRT